MAALFSRLRYSANLRILNGLSSCVQAMLHKNVKKITRHKAKVQSNAAAAAAVATAAAVKLHVRKQRGGKSPTSGGPAGCALELQSESECSAVKQNSSTLECSAILCQSA